MNTKHLTLGAAVAAVALLLFAATGASAATSAQSGYSAPAGNVQQKLGGAQDPRRPKTVVVENRGGILPFTGLDLGLVGVAGAVLLAFGLGVRRLSRLET